MAEATIDRERGWQRRFFAVLVGGVVTATALASWAFAPMLRSAHSGATPPPLRVASAAAQPERRPLDRADFDKRLWWVLPKPIDSESAAEEAKPPATLPLELELIGITEVEGTLVAALYDRRAARLRLVRQGETIAEAHVAEVSKDKVRLTRGDGELLLLRRRPGS